MSQASTFVADLAIVTGVAAATGMLARRLHLPRILGYLLAGLIVGPSLPIPLFADPERVLTLAEFGVVLVMFAVGLEFRVGKLLQILPVSGFSGLIQVGTLMWAGYTVGMLLGWGPVGATFLGAALSISSTMVVTGIFAQQPVDTSVRENVLGILVLQDVVAIVMMAAMTALAAGQSLAPLDLALVIFRLVGLLIGMISFGMLLVPRLVRSVVAHGGTEGIAVLAVGLAFGAALLAEEMGYSVALGAFVAGILVAESGRGAEVEHTIEPLRAVFAAIFFVSVGMSVDPFVAITHLPTALLVALVVILAQLGSVTVASLLSGCSLRRALLSGLALGQLGEFSFIIATIGTDAEVVPASLLPILVTVATVTSFSTAMLLRRGEALVTEVDRRLPERLQRLFVLHQAWVERLRARPAADQGPARRAFRSLAIDWSGFIALAAVSLALREPAARWLQEIAGIPPTQAFVFVNGATVLMAIPLLIGLFQNARLLGRLLARSVVPEPDAAGRRLVPLLEAVTNLVVLIGVGIPALALLRPLVGGPWGEPILLIGIATAAMIVWRNLGAVEGEIRSGAAQLAELMSHQTGAEEIHHENIALLPGLDHVLGLPLPAGAYAVGRTLAEINLRARTGATVVAIHRARTAQTLPTASERLVQDDVLALAGPEEAVRQARRLLLGGASDEPPSQERA